MTVQSTVARADYQGNNVTTLFTVPFYFLDNSHIKVVRTDNSTSPPTTALLVLGSDYVLTGAGIQIGGQVQTTIAPTATQVLTVLRNVPFTQLIHYVPNDPFPAATHEQALDQLTMEVQELNEVTTHALQFPSYEPVPAVLPAASVRANMLLGFGPTGQVQLNPVTASIGAGDLRIEEWADGAGYTSGVSTSVTLSRTYGTKANLGPVVMQGIVQDPASYSLNGTTLTFNAVIPAGVSPIWCLGGTTLSTNVPPDGSVGDTQLSWGSVLTRAVASVSALQNLDVTKYQRASTNAYYAGGQGAADYFYDPAYPQTSANGGSAIASLVGTGCWRIVPRGTMNLFQWGAKGDSNGTSGNGTDDTAAIQAAVTWQAATGAPIDAPSVSTCFRTTAAIVATAPINIVGAGCEPMIGVGGTNVNTRGPGSWFYFDHPGRGFSVNDGGTGLVSATFRGIGTIRNQPTPNGSASFTPNANDFDFYLFNCEVVMRDFVTLNATNGVMITANALSSQGRATIDGWRGQPLSVGLRVDFAADVVKTNNWHFWPFWSFAQGVLNYMVGSAIAYYSGRNDNPQLSNIFAYQYAYGILTYNTANGSTHKLKATNVEFDYNGKAALYVGAGVSGFIAYLSNFTSQGQDSGGGGGIIFDDASSGSEIAMSNIDMGLFNGNAIYIGGTNNVMRMATTRLYQYNKANGNSPAVSVQPNNLLYYDAQTCEFLAPFNSAVPLSSTGTITSTGKWAAFSGTTDGSGQITVTHNLGHTPTGALTNVNNSAASLNAQLISSNSTTATFKVFTTSTGAALASGAIAFSYQLFF